jgi:hypothetical protein
MTTSPRPKPTARTAAHGNPITDYIRSQPSALRAICVSLQSLITTALPKATSKVWHGSPVWFIDDNPVVGYSVKAKAISLLFWNGTAFKEPGLKQVGKYGAAEAVFRDAEELDAQVISRWLRKAKANVFDSKAFFQKLRAGQRPKR